MLIDRGFGPGFFVLCFEVENDYSRGAGKKEQQVPMENRAGPIGAEIQPEIIGNAPGAESDHEVSAGFAAVPAGNDSQCGRH
jgi:hypothetical protein